MVTFTLSSVAVSLGRRAAVRDVSATLSPGALIGIVGPNGAGKSTLMRAMLGLLPLAGGEIAIDGTAVSRLSRRQIARETAYLPQGQTLHWPLSVERLVSLGRLPHMAPMQRLAPVDHAGIEDAMARADVLGLRERIATELSGGERARVMLARALAVGAPALLADEPLAALDLGHQIEVMTLLRREAEAGALVVAVLHDLGMAARYCDRLLLIDGGRLVADGAPMEVLTVDRLRGVYGVEVLIDNDGPVPAITPLRRV
jgi:iron complex transport system ATP-binding protein